MHQLTFNTPTHRSAAGQLCETYKTGRSVGGTKVEENSRTQLYSAAKRQENRRGRDRTVWRMCPVWLLVAVMVVGVTRGNVNQCLEHPSCQGVDDESSMMECIQICRPDLTTEGQVIPSDGLLQPLSPSDPESLSSLSLLPSSSPQVKRSYSMEHFRWGKPVGRKRRPIKLYTSNGMEEESAEDLPEEMSRREAEDKQQEKKDSTYKMKHFRWSGPPASKRNNGFMKSRDESRPLLALFKSGVVRDGQEQKAEQ